MSEKRPKPPCFGQFPEDDEYDEAHCYDYCHYWQDCEKKTKEREK